MAMMAVVMKKDDSEDDGDEVEDSNDDEDRDCIEDSSDDEENDDGYDDDRMVKCDVTKLKFVNLWNQKCILAKNQHVGASCPRDITTVMLG